MPSFSSDGFRIPAPSPVRPPGYSTTKDVYLYINGSKPVPLCISCAVARRRGGAEVALANGKPGRVRCADCG